MQTGVIDSQVMDPAGRMRRVRSAAERHHSNATASWQGGVEEFGVILRRNQGDGFVSDAVTPVLYTVSLCVLNALGVAEGSSALRINGQPCRITGPVVPDSGGWATFPIVFTEGADAGP
jgi:hypothetical protein